MKETIFFNREQLKIIRYYGMFYRIFLGYGIPISAFLLSLILSWGLFSSNWVKNIFLLEREKEPIVSEARRTYNENYEHLK